MTSEEAFAKITIILSPYLIHDLKNNPMPEVKRVLEELELTSKKVKDYDDCLIPKRP